MMGLALGGIAAALPRKVWGWYGSTATTKDLAVSIDATAAGILIHAGCTTSVGANNVKLIVVCGGSTYELSSYSIGGGVGVVMISGAANGSQTTQVGYGGGCTVSSTAHAFTLQSITAIRVETAGNVQYIAVQQVDSP